MAGIQTNHKPINECGMKADLYIPCRWNDIGQHLMVPSPAPQLNKKKNRFHRSFGLVTGWHIVVSRANAVGEISFREARSATTERSWLHALAVKTIFNVTNTETEWPTAEQDTTFDVVSSFLMAQEEIVKKKDNRNYLHVTPTVRCPWCNAARCLSVWKLKLSST
jgi:hypothetical protein